LTSRTAAVAAPDWVDLDRREGESTMGTDIPAARQGLLKFIAKRGGSIPMKELHTHSLVFYQAGHQAFSQIMEGLVADELVVFEDGVFLLTDKGRVSL
jgi:hypothetical protein